MKVSSFLSNAYRFRPNAYSVFLYVLTLLLIIEVYLLGSRYNYMAIALMIGILLVSAQFTKNMLVILMGGLLIPAMSAIVYAKLFRSGSLTYIG